MNSLRSIRRAVRFEFNVRPRSSQKIDHARNPAPARGHGETSPGRPKSDADDDYRYFPEPDLAPLTPSRGLVEELRAQLRGTPTLRTRRLRSEWGIARSSSRTW